MKEAQLPETGYTFDVRHETDLKQVYRVIQRQLSLYKDEKRGATMLAIQSLHTLSDLCFLMPGLAEFPLVPIHIQDSEALYQVMDWQKNGAKIMIRHFLNIETVLSVKNEFIILSLTSINILVYFE